jgi:hypothetical protein
LAQNLGQLQPCRTTQRCTRRDVWAELRPLGQPNLAPFSHRQVVAAGNAVYRPRDHRACTASGPAAHAAAREMAAPAVGAASAV